MQDHPKWIELFSIWLAVAALLIGIQQSWLASRALGDQQISAAWQILAMKGGGSTGKQYALQSLMSLQGELTHIDMSCTGNGGEMTEPPAIRRCDDGPVLRDLDLRADWTRFFTPKHISFVNFEGVDLDEAQFDGQNMFDVNFGAADLLVASFDHTSISHSNFKEARLVGASFVGADFDNIDFTDALLISADFTDAKPHEWFSSINISGADFCETECAKGLTQDLVGRMYFFEGSPPRGLGRINPEFEVMVCAPGGQACPTVVVPD